MSKQNGRIRYQIVLGNEKRRTKQLVDGEVTGGFVVLCLHFKKLWVKQVNGKIKQKENYKKLLALINSNQSATLPQL